MAAPRFRRRRRTGRAAWLAEPFAARRAHDQAGDSGPEEDPGEMPWTGCHYWAQSMGSRELAPSRRSWK